MNDERDERDEYPERPDAAGASGPTVHYNDLVKLSQWLFDRFCEDNVIAEPQRPQVHPLQFMRWFEDTVVRYNSEELVRQLQVSEQAADFVLSLPRVSGGVNQLMGLWPYMVLGRRPCNQPLLSANLLLVLTWRDGVCCPLSMFAHRDTNPEPIRDAEVVHLLTARGPELANLVSTTGLDAYHDAHLKFTGMGDPAVLATIEAMLKASSVKPDAAMADKIEMTLALLRTLFPGSIPPGIRQKMAAARRVAEGGTPGGWNDQG